MCQLQSSDISFRTVSTIFLWVAACNNTEMNSSTVVGPVLTSKFYVGSGEKEWNNANHPYQNFILILIILSVYFQEELWRLQLENERLRAQLNRLPPSTSNRISLPSQSLPSSPSIQQNVSVTALFSRCLSAMLQIFEATTFSVSVPQWRGTQWELIGFAL